jgi:cytochrome bd-type quinol oxidase subunit 2
MIIRLWLVDACVAYGQHYFQMKWGDCVNSAARKMPVFSWLAVVLAIAVWFFIFRVFHYQVNNLRAYNSIALVAALIPVAMGIIALFRREKHRIVSLLGIVIASLTFLSVLLIFIFFGM